MTNNKISLRHAWLVIFSLLLPSIVAAAPGENNADRKVLSLGTSSSVGVMPDANGVNQINRKLSYSAQLVPILEAAGYAGGKLSPIFLGCPGETTVTMINGGICEYAEGSQLAQALVRLRAHKDKVALITIDMGANDILAADCVDELGNVDLICIFGALGQIGTNLPIILAALREAAPQTPIVGMNSFNPFLSAWLVGNEPLARTSDELAKTLNFGILAPTYAGFGASTANVYAFFNSGDFDTMVEFPAPGSGFFVPLNVATLCALTYNCTPPPVGPNVHANTDGYGVMAAAAAAVLVP